MDNYEKTKSILWGNSDISQESANKALQLLCERKIDFGDLFFERVVSESFSLEEGIVKGGSFNISQGVGVRAIDGTKTGFAYSDVLDNKSLYEACFAFNGVY